MTPFDRLYMTSYQSAVKTKALSCTIFEIFDIKKFCDLDTYVRGHSIRTSYIVEFYRPWMQSPGWGKGKEFSRTP